ncbi:protein PXR1-like [Helianthus annuus]|uniref:protein PXR1-like n=1 Tax=Helianthus annuus TaxID=4232 RepID=UPI000B903844|nr:protein PXR1-like [Helianthus annuus]
MVLKNNGEFANLSLSKFIEKLEVQEMEQRKMEKMKNYNGDQDIDSTVEDEMAYVYYESQQYSLKKKEEEPVAKEEASEKAPIFDHSSDEESDDDSEEIRKIEFYKREFSPDRYNLYFAGKMEEINERQAAKKKNHKAATVKEKDDSDDENGRAVKKQFKETPVIKIEKEADTEKMPEKIYPTVEGMKAFEEEKPEVKNSGNLKCFYKGQIPTS